MLATSSYVYSAVNGHLPTIPSPLSPRSANIYGRRSVFMSSDEQSDPNKKRISRSDIPFSKRPVKKAPSPKQDELATRRRNMFLSKVREGREEKRYEARGEDIMRLDFVQRQKQWEAERAREARQMPSDLLEDDEEDEYDLPSSSGAMQISAPPSQQPMLEDEVDEVLQREREELEALLSLMPQQTGLEEDRRSEHLWSDDEDYDALFSEMMNQDAVRTRQNQAPEASQDGEAMDMS